MSNAKTYKYNAQSRMLDAKKMNVHSTELEGRIHFMIFCVIKSGVTKALGKTIEYRYFKNKFQR